MKKLIIILILLLCAGFVYAECDGCPVINKNNEESCVRYADNIFSENMIKYYQLEPLADNTKEIYYCAKDKTIKLFDDGKKDLLDLAVFNSVTYGIKNMKLISVQPNGDVTIAVKTLGREQSSTGAVSRTTTIKPNQEKTFQGVKIFCEETFYHPVNGYALCEFERTQEPCGDGFCDKTEYEDETNCPQDCKKQEEPEPVVSTEKCSETYKGLKLIAEYTVDGTKQASKEIWSSDEGRSFLLDEVLPIKEDLKFSTKKFHKEKDIMLFKNKVYKFDSEWDPDIFTLRDIYDEKGFHLAVKDIEYKDKEKICIYRFKDSTSFLKVIDIISYMKGYKETPVIKKEPATEPECTTKADCPVPECPNYVVGCRNGKCYSECPLVEEPECDGCLLDEKCVNYGFRTNGLYCSLDKELISQKTEGEFCDNNFECGSNVCVDNECISAGFIQKIINWFKRLF